MQFDPLQGNSENALTAQCIRIEGIWTKVAHYWQLPWHIFLLLTGQLQLLPLFFANLMFWVRSSPRELREWWLQCSARSDRKYWRKNGSLSAISLRWRIFFDTLRPNTPFITVFFSIWCLGFKHQHQHQAEIEVQSLNSLGAERISPHPFCLQLQHQLQVDVEGHQSLDSLQGGSHRSGVIRRGREKRSTDFSYLKTSFLSWNNSLALLLARQIIAFDFLKQEWESNKHVAKIIHLYIAFIRKCCSSHSATVDEWQVDMSSFSWGWACWVILFYKVIISVELISPLIHSTEQSL